MKKLAILLALLFALASAGAVRAEGTDGDFEYRVLPNGAAVITGYHGSAAELAIPAELGGCRVSGIDGGAFESAGSLTRVIIPEGIASIGDCAFSGCTSLVSLTVPDSVTYLGAQAFEGCASLTLAVGRGSAAEAYALQTGVDFCYAGSLSWLRG